MNSIADRLPDRPISSRSQPIGARERETDRGEVRAGGGGGGTRGIPPSQGHELRPVVIRPYMVIMDICAIIRQLEAWDPWIAGGETKLDELALQ